MIFSTHLSNSDRHAQLTRDLTLSSEAPVAFCTRLILQQLMWKGSSDQLFELFGRDPRTMDLVDARNLLLRLGFGSTKEVLNNWQQLDSHYLPALYFSPECQPYVLFRNVEGTVEAANAEGRCNVQSISVGGSLVLFHEVTSTERVSLLHQVLFRFRTQISHLYIISFVLALLALVVPFYIRGVYNIVIPSKNLTTGFLLMVAVFLIFCIEWSLKQWRTNQLAFLAARLDALFGMRLLEKTIRSESISSSSLDAHRYQNRQRSLDALLVYFKGPFATALLDAPFILLYLAAIAWIAGPLVLIPLILMGVTAALVLLIASHYRVAADLCLRSEIGIGEAQQELVGRFLEVKQSNLEWLWFQRLRGLSAQSTKSALTINRQLGRLQVIVSTSSQLAGVLTLAFGTWMASKSHDGVAAMGTLIAAMFFVWRVFTPFQQLMNALLRFSAMRHQFLQLDQFLKHRSSSQIFGQSTHLRLCGSILLESAASRLSRDGNLALTRVSLSIEPGQILALTGQAGCGKSSVLRLLNQLYPLTSGTLLFDGVDYRQFNTVSIQRNIALVMERSQLLPGTILSNLMAMNVDATADQVRMICRQLRILDFLESLPQGLETSLDESLIFQLPHGVQRLLTLAQALIKDTSILLIDDLSQCLSPDHFQTFIEVLPTLRTSIFTGQPRSVLIATDNRALLEQADFLCILDHGVTTFQGTADQLRQRLQNST